MLLLRAARGFRPASSLSGGSAYHTLEGLVRGNEQVGGKHVARLRKENFVPGVIYGNGSDDGKVLVSVPKKQIVQLYNKTKLGFESTVCELEVDGEKHIVTPFQLSQHPVTNEVQNVNYVRYTPGRRIKVPVVYVNEERSPGLRRGGFILHLQRTLDVVCDESTAVPDFLEVDVSGLNVGQSINTTRVNVPQGVTLVTKKKPFAPLGDEKVVFATLAGKKAAATDKADDA